MVVRLRDVLIGFSDGWIGCYGRAGATEGASLSLWQELNPAKPPQSEA